MQILDGFPILQERSVQAITEEIIVPLLSDTSEHASEGLNTVMAAVFGLLISEVGDGPICYFTSESEGWPEGVWEKFLELEKYPVECGITSYTILRAGVAQGEMVAVGFHEGVPFRGKCSIQYWDIFVYPFEDQIVLT